MRNVKAQTQQNSLRDLAWLEQVAVGILTEAGAEAPRIKAVRDICRATVKQVERRK